MSETVYLVMYAAQHEGEDVRCVCSTEAVARSWADMLREKQRQEYGFDPKREAFRVDSWSILTEKP